jgi:N-acyl-D-aspartate/D-glutamate deacylase
MTQMPAELFGLRDRGVVRKGAHADLVLFDPETVATGDVRLVDDLPGGTSRLYADAIGVPHVFVNGAAIVRDGVATEARPGTVMRSGRDTYTVRIPADA